jgi:hypothetical protein
MATPKLFMDAHVDAAITEQLRLRHVNVLTTQEDGADELDDEALLDRATAIGRLTFTQDRIFWRLLGFDSASSWIFPASYLVDCS